jgi:hypothetical protein
MPFDPFDARRLPPRQRELAIRGEWQAGRPASHSVCAEQGEFPVKAILDYQADQRQLTPGKHWLLR